MIASIRPNTELEDVVPIFLNKAGAGKKDPTLAKDFEFAVARKEEIEENLSRSVFKPAARVFNAQAYGYKIFQERGVVTEREYEELLDRVPKEIGLEAQKAPFSGPDREDALYLVDLKGLPLDVILSMRRVHIYFDNHACLQDVFLEPERQLTREQGAEYFKYVISQNMKNRPDKFKPSASATSVEELRQQHAAAAELTKRAEEKLLAAQKAATKRKTGGGSSASESEESEEEELPQEVGPGSITQKNPKSKKKTAASDAKKLKLASATLSTASTAAASKLSSTTSAPGTLGKGALALMDETEIVSLGGRSGGGKEAKTFQGLDSDMVSVAEKHMATPSGSSVKCLAQLVPKAFLLGPEEGGLAGITAKGLAASISGVGSFKKGKKRHETVMSKNVKF